MNEVPWKTLCLCMAIVLFVLAAVSWAPDPWPWRVKLIAAGLAFATLAQFVRG
jgi:hypothetical protein